ncbi:helix-turn-helix transcriptional regulator [Streptomyces sp. 21So2-11]|uniref:helix-turn-helix domain-containing protein n=1 Tax=Streptomyces sp. 21So2-11 TaxID=3144408 RepID=UPI00321A25FF
MSVEQELEDPRKQFGDELKKARLLHPPGRLTQTDLARKARTSKSQISRIENEHGYIPPALPPLFDEFFGTDGLFKRLHDEITTQSFPALYQQRMTLEREAVEVAEWSPTLVPGLLQTPAYADAILRAGDPRASDQEIARLVSARLRRQEVLWGPTPPDLRVVLCESVLLRQIVSAELMRDQLKALLQHADRPTSSLQILPLRAAPHLLMDYGASFLTNKSHVTIVCVETYRTAGMVDDPELVRAATRAYDGLVGEAHPQGMSADLIRDLLETL